MEIEKISIDEIIKEIVDAGYKPGQLINYDELRELSKKYGRGLKETYFAQNILGITYSSYMSCKNSEQRVRILKTQEKILTEEERQKIKQEIIEAGYKPGQLITYEEIRELAKRFGRELKEIDFAQNILGITYGNFRACKIRRTRVKILKTQEKILTDEEKEEIIQKIIEAGYKPSQSINYDELKELSRIFGKGLKEVDFAQNILGVSFSNYNNCKYNRTKVRIKDGIKIGKAKDIIALYTVIPKFYSKEDIEIICKEYNITIDDFITYVYIQNFYDNKPFINALEKNGGLWIGKVRMSKDYVQKHIETIEKIVTEIAKSLCKKYRINQRIEDYKQDMILYIIESMGDLERNLGNSNEIFDIISKKIMRKYKGEILQSLKISHKCQGMYRMGRIGKNDTEFEIQYPDESINIIKEIEQKLETENIDSNQDRMNKCINMLKKYIEIGVSKTEAIEKTAQSVNIDAETMLEYMKLYLLQNGKVKIVKDKIIPSVNSEPLEESR